MGASSYAMGQVISPRIVNLWEFTWYPLEKQRLTGRHHPHEAMKL
jgi:hypothetical protein